MKSLMMLGLALVVSGCATYRPVIDTKNVDMSKFERDLGECQQYAQQVAGPGTGAAVGAGAVAALGFLMATVAGRRFDAGATARVGAVAGAAGGAAGGAENEMNVIRRCVQGRGYNVLQ